MVVAHDKKAQKEGIPCFGIVKGKVVEKRIRYILTNLKDVNKVCLKDAVG
jgi:hypothetical protein